jgi:hypothetical protein
MDLTNRMKAVFDSEDESSSANSSGSSSSSSSKTTNSVNKQQVSKKNLKNTSGDIEHSTMAFSPLYEYS